MIAEFNWMSDHFLGVAVLIWLTGKAICEIIDVWRNKE